MRLANFIASNIEPILQEWVNFAQTRGAAGRALDLKGLRDHAAEMLRVIVRDLGTPQSAAEQSEKSKGNAVVDADAPETAAEVHGAGRSEDGFTLDEMVSEYRALRASVLRLWARECPSLSPTDFEDLMRFNEAIDQALAESVTRYSRDQDRAREMFVAVLGHDLRTPLSAVLMASRFMRDLGTLEEPHKSLTERIVSSATRMQHMADELLDFTRGRLGSGIPIERRPHDLGALAREAMAEITAAHPAAMFEFVAEGDLNGQFDAARLGQTLSNLLGNALQHGEPGRPVLVELTGMESEVIFRVRNQGKPIAAVRIPTLFSAFKRLREDGTSERYAHHLGLGLYIAERIVAAHGGSIAVTSDERFTEFTVRLPRDLPR